MHMQLRGGAVRESKQIRRVHTSHSKDPNENSSTCQSLDKQCHQPSNSRRPRHEVICERVAKRSFPLEGVITRVARATPFLIYART